MVADELKDVDAYTRQCVISQAGIQTLEAMNGDDPEKEHMEADNALLEALYAHGEYDLVRAWKEAAKRAEFSYL